MAITQVEKALTVFRGIGVRDVDQYSRHLHFGQRLCALSNPVGARLSRTKAAID